MARAMFVSTEFLALLEASQFCKRILCLDTVHQAEPIFFRRQETLEILLGKVRYRP